MTDHPLRDLLTPYHAPGTAPALTAPMLNLVLKLTGKQFIIAATTASATTDIAYADTLADAQATAEAMAHRHAADVYILKPITRVSPKRDTTSTALSLPNG